MAKEIPIGVKVIAVLFFIGTVLFFISGMLFISGADVPEELGGVNLGTTYSVISGVISIILALVVFLAGLGLWKGRRWAWITAIVLSCLGVVSSLISVIGGDILGSMISLIIYAVIGSYLLFSHEVKGALS